MRKLIGIEVGGNILGVLVNNDWKTGDFHFIVLDIYHEQPKGADSAAFGISLGLLGFRISIGGMYEQKKH